MIELETDTQDKKAWVVFTGKTDISWLKILRKNFRHCFVLINDGQRWFSIDPLSHYTDVQIQHHIQPDFDLPAWFEEQGNTVVPAIFEHSHKEPAPWGICSCVEQVKRILGIHCRFILTPWQLYKFLNKASFNSNLKGEYLWEV